MWAYLLDRQCFYHHVSTFGVTVSPGCTVLGEKALSLCYISCTSSAVHIDRFFNINTRRFICICSLYYNWKCNTLVNFHFLIKHTRDISAVICRNSLRSHFCAWVRYRIGYARIYADINNTALSGIECGTADRHIIFRSKYVCRIYRRRWRIINFLIAVWAIIAVAVIVIIILAH